MLRDFKSVRRNKGDGIVEIENVPINPNDLSSNPNPNFEASGKTKFERTPVKSKANSSETSSLPFRTPERQAFGRNRFGFSTMIGDEGRSDSTRNGPSFYLTPRVPPNKGRTYSGYSDSTSTQTTPSKSVTKPPNPTFLPSNSRLPAIASARASSYSSLSRGFPASTPHSCVLDTVDVPHFDLKEDPSFWMDHNVQVIIRVRPLNGIERNTHGYNRCVRQEGAQSISWTGHPETRFTFDHVACETVDQEMLFRMAGLPMVENCLSGYNSCMFAYGQTGSGKTYTMLGEIEDVEFKPSPHRGMTPRIFEFLFARIRAEEESRSDEKLKYSCKCSFLEIYNEQITDLLDPASTNLLLREDVKKGVYVENLSEFEVHTVGDVLRLLIEGSSNRKVAATNMNRESSRSHCVFTCIIESKWERDSTTNLRFARLNLVDLAGSERQKSSGAEGERLKEAANINKSLSTLGHVIMLLVDIAHGKPRHVPYRDSRLTFLLQDSLGGNSKTMIIANVSPSICCAAETLNTLKFAQRAKLIQNNAVVNEDSSGDVAVLQHQILLLKEELSALKRQNDSRILAFDPSSAVRDQDNSDGLVSSENDQLKPDGSLESESKAGLVVSCKQLKSLEMMLAGALRREQMAETSIKQLEAEIEQLNRLVRQREEDSRCSKMMLKFREDKIQRMESVVEGLKPVDGYLLEENAALYEEIQMLRAKVDRNPEVTRFAVENIRLLEQLRRFQDFYEEGERDLLMSEVSNLRAQLIHFLDCSKHQHNLVNMKDTANNDRDKESFHSELTKTMHELSECQSKLKYCTEINSKLSREIEELHAQLRNKDTETHSCHDVSNAMKDVQLPHLVSQAVGVVEDEQYRTKHKDVVNNAEEIVNLELELDILRIILKEEKLSRGKLEEEVSSLTRDVENAEERVLLVSKQHEETKAKLEEAKSVIDAFESQQLFSISELEDQKNTNSHYMELLDKQELEISSLKKQIYAQESSMSSCLRRSECEESPFQEQLNRMQASLDKAKRLNMWYQRDHASQRSNEEEIDEVRRQAEAETAEVIVCLQEELSILQQHIQESDMREKEFDDRRLILEMKLKELQEALDMVSHDNKVLHQNLLEKDRQSSSLTDDWKLMSCEIEEALLEGHEAIRSASDQLDFASTSDRRGWISEQMGKMIKQMSDRETVIEGLNNCLEEANIRVNDMERMVMSLRGAAMAMTESHQQACYEKDKEILQLRSELKACLSANIEEICMSENSIESIQTVEAGVFSLQAAFSDFEKQCESKILALSLKLDKAENYVQEAKCAWHRTKESIEYELVGAEAITAQKAVEASCVLARFEEVQDMMKEADMMINGLMIANETLKFEIEDLRSTKIILTGERDSLLDEVHGLRSANDFKDQNCKSLENQFKSVAVETVSLIEELQNLILVLQETSEGTMLSLTHELCCLKSELQETMNSTRSSIEDIWSEVLVKDCAHSVLHLCHMGVMSDAITGLNTENRLLHHGLLESSALVLHLNEGNWKSKQDFEMFKVIKEKLLSNIENSLVRISSKESEAREFNLKLNNFEENLVVLQQQEELMLERSNSMNSELVNLKELHQAVISSLAEQDKLLKKSDKLMKSQACNFAADLYAKDLELLYLASELQQLAHHHSDMENEQIYCFAALDSLMIEIVTLKIIADFKEELLSEKETEAVCMQTRVKEVQASEANVSIQLQSLEAEYKNLTDHMRKKENDLENMQNGMFLLQSSSHDLQNKVLMLEEENESLKNRLLDLKSENCILLQESQDKDSELKSSMGFIDTLKQQNCKLEENISTLQSRIGQLEKSMEAKVAELDDFQHLQTSTAEALCNKSQDLDGYAIKLSALQEENLLLKDELQTFMQMIFEALSTLSSKVTKCACSLEATDLESSRMLKNLEERSMLLADQMSEDGGHNLDLVSKFLDELERVDYIAKGLVSSNLSLQEELHRKDGVLNGLVFDISLLQESVANGKDQKAEIEKLELMLASTENELAIKSSQLDEFFIDGEKIEAMLEEQGDIINSLEIELENSNQSVKTLSDENAVLNSRVEDFVAANGSIEKELCEKKSVIDNLENELLEMGNTLVQLNDLVESLKSNLDDANSVKNELQKELLVLEGKVETAHALAEENEAIAVEAQQIAESRRIYAEEREEEVQLLERSVQELDSTISVLENKVDVLKGEAERQRLQREELELELHSLKNQMHTVESTDANFKRHLEEKTRNLQEALTQIKVLEKDLANRDAEVAQCKAHISELTLHAEAQACEYKQRFKELEAMIEEVKAEEASSHERNVSSSKLEKNPTKGRGSASPFKAKGSSSPFKARGSGSPFKCIGLGLGHQLKSEKDEELNAERLRIEELEALATSRQKEIFKLNARLAATESMTHDVIRDLLGVKLDMSNCASVLDNQQVQKMTQNVQVGSTECQDQEVNKLRKQLNHFTEERQGWLEEIDRRQAELFAARIAVEKHCQQEQLLSTENEVLKRDIANHKKRVVELEEEVKKLSGQQNLQQRIHHHAKIKEENNMLKAQNEDLSSRLQRAELYLSRVRDKVVRCRATDGRSVHTKSDEERRLRNDLNDTEKEKLQLVSLCTSILKVAGVAKPAAEIDLSVAEEALVQLQRHISSLETELRDVKVKNKTISEKLRVAELKAESSPFSSRSEDNRQTPRRKCDAPFLSALDR